MKTRILILLVFIPIFLLGQSTGPSVNLQKYWRFREHLKNFVVPGYDNGCSLVSKYRQQYYDVNSTNYNVIADGFLDYGDETQFLGHYIGMLAMEYKMETDNGLDPSSTKMELAFALNAFNRLDLGAEPSWNTTFNSNHIFGVPPACDDYTSYLNGFFIREDVPSDFINQIVDNDLVENKLNSSYFPAEDGRIADKPSCYFNEGYYETASAFAPPLANGQGEAIGENCEPLDGVKFGPTEGNLDQATQMMMGLAITVRCVPANTAAYDRNGNIILSGIGEEAQHIADRITSWVRKYNWEIQNPVTCSCVKGVSWAAEDIQNGTNTHWAEDPCKCISGGAEMQIFSFGIAMANSRIQTATLGQELGSGDAHGYFCHNYLCDPVNGGCSLSCVVSNTPDVVLAASQTLWMNNIQNNIVDDDYKVRTLAAIGNVWDGNTGSALNSRCGFGLGGTHVGDSFHFPLLNAFLYDGSLDNTSVFTEAFYESLLDQCECYKNISNDNVTTWNSPGGLMYGGYSGNGYYTENDNLSYLFYFNLYNLFKPSYLSSTGGYTYIEPSKLCETDITKTGFYYDVEHSPFIQNTQFIESDKKGFHAANSITAMAGSDNLHAIIPYVIDNDNDNQPWPLKQANITFEAGSFVELEPGFEAHLGVEFHATINPTLVAMNCNDGGKAAQHNNTSDSSNQNKNTPMNVLSREQTQQAFNQELQHQYEQQAQRQIAQTNKSIKDSSFINCTIKPNPNSGVFTITINSNTETGKTKITIYSVLGEIVYQTTIADKQIVIDISNQAQGIYYVKIENENGSLKTQKIIKE